jgi:hypothetical protein
MMPCTLPTYLPYISIQHNLVHDIVLVELRREPQQNILFHIYLYNLKVVLPSPETLSWDACSMAHLGTHSPMHLK